MPRKRQLDPDFFSDEDIAKLSPFARLFYQGTWCYCEDTAVFKVKPTTLKTQILPYDNIDAMDLYIEIRKLKFYIEFLNNGEKFAFIKGFHKRQIIQHPSKSILPLPPEPFLSFIPKKIRTLNESSMSPQSVLNEEYDRVELVELVELSRVEESRVNKNREPSADFKEKAEKAKKEGFNIYALTNKLYKDTGLAVELPWSVIEKILDSYMSRGDKVEDPWPYFRKALKGEAEKYCISLQKNGAKNPDAVNLEGIKKIRLLIASIGETLDERTSGAVIQKEISPSSGPR